ncbi:MAG TPA: ComEC/Rec2 family competence protein, partial [Nocardioidaceae bacterium]|nr:ComEC/Rec2 family competence protein [Nocardioidaceae bacterium]
MTAAPDLRLLLPGGAAWLGSLSGFLLPWWVWASLVLAVAATAFRIRTLALLAVAVTLGVSGASATLRVAEQSHSPVAAAAAERGYVSATVRLTSDPVERAGRFGGYVVARGTVESVEWRGRAAHTRARVLLLGRGDWSGVGLGAIVRVSGRLAPADSVDLAGTLSVTRAPVLLALPPSILLGASTARGWIREASSGASPVARELVPGLVVGDDVGLPDEVVEEFREAGLTHLTAVSGTNLTLVVGFLLIVARWCGVRSRGLVLVGLLGVVGFVLLARPEPSVVRAAAMGSVALLGLGAGGRGRGVRALSVAVLVLLLLDPWLALSVGFALSATATAGILFLAPPVRDALAQWLPRWAAE